MISVVKSDKINSKQDIGVGEALLNASKSNSFDYSPGADIGGLVMTNARVNLGDNMVGFVDKNFSDANDTAKGPQLRCRVKFDRQSVR